MTREVPISSLKPFESLPSDASLVGEVSLQWPYSSSTYSSATLLVDRDPRRRHDRGRVRIVFRGSAAKQVAQARLGIGDVVSVELMGARWGERDERAHNLTPGKAVEGELAFERRLRLTVLEDGDGNLNGRVIEVDDRSHVSKEASSTPRTPARQSRGIGSLGLGTPLAGGYASPAFMQRLRLSQEHFLNSPGLADQVGELDSTGSRKRRRLSYKSVVEVNFALQTPARTNTPRTAEDEEVDSVLDEVFGVGNAHTLGEGATVSKADPFTEVARESPMNLPVSLRPPPPELDLQPSSELPDLQATVRHGSQARKERINDHDDDEADITHPRLSQPSEVFMPPPPLPPLTMPVPIADTGEAQPDSPKTPQLGPVSATNLPLPSPFPQTPRSHDVIATQADEPDVDTVNYENDISARGISDALSAQLEPAKLTPPTEEDVQGLATTPLADVLQHPELLDSHIEAHASPSSGSEADVSSEDETMLETSMPKEKASPVNDIKAESLSQSKIDPIDADTQFEYSQEEASSESHSSESEESGLSVMGSPSDDESDVALPSDESMDEDDPDMAVMNDSSSSVSSSQRQSPRPDTVDPEVDFGYRDAERVLTPGTPSKKQQHEDPSRAQKLLIAKTSSESKPSGEHESQDEAAAFAAMDDALHDLNASAVELEQAPPQPLASHVVPAYEDLHDEDGLILPTTGVTETARPAAHESLEHVDEASEHARQPPVEDLQAALRGAPPADKPRLSLEELADQARARSSVLKAAKQRSPSVEVIDLSGVEHIDLPVNSPPSIQQVVKLEQSIADSMDSPATTLAADSSRPVSRSLQESLDAAMVGIAEASQELGLLSGMPGGESETPRELNKIEVRGDRIDDGSDFDDKLLAGLEDKENADEVEYHKHLTTADLSESLGSRLVPHHPHLSNGDESFEAKMKAMDDRLQRRVSSRLSIVPGSLNTWFSRPTDPATKPDHDRRKTTTAASPQTPPPSTAPITRNKSDLHSRSRRQKSVSPPPLKRYAQSQGLSTSLTYFTPLTNLDLHLNNTSAKIDVIGVVTRASDDPRRAKAGTRDWYTVFYITDPALYDAEDARLADLKKANGTSSQRSTATAEPDEPSVSQPPNGTADAAPSSKREDTRVEVFRPWKASLPAVSVGDVILLRCFTVKSRGRRNYLLSGEESAWCAFRSAHSDGEEVKTQGKRWWDVAQGLKEEMRGPPMEVGAEEREKATELKGWWDVVSLVGRKGKGRATL